MPSFDDSKNGRETPSGIQELDIDNDELLFVNEGDGYHLIDDDGDFNHSSRREESETIDSDMIATYQHAIRQAAIKNGIAPIDLQLNRENSSTRQDYKQTE